jgi:hypothetical protein
LQIEALMQRNSRVPGAAQHEAISAFTRVFDALWRSGALQTRDRYGLWRSRISGAPLRDASRCTASGTRAIEPCAFITRLAQDSSLAARDRRPAQQFVDGKGRGEDLAMLVGVPRPDLQQS